MSKVKIKVDDLKDGLDYLNAGFQKTGSSLESGLMHMEISKGAWLVISTHSRYTSVRYAVPLIGKAEDFEALIGYETFRNIATSMPEEMEITLTSNKTHVELEGTGKYRFVKFDTLFEAKQPETTELGSLEFEDIHEVVTRASQFTTEKAGTLEGKTVRLSYEEDTELLTAQTFDGSTAAQFSVSVKGLKPFDMYLKGSELSKISRREGTATLVSSGEMWGISIPRGRLLMIGLNEVDPSTEIVNTVIEKSRPYDFEVSGIHLEAVVKRLLNYEPDALIAEVSDDQLTLKAKTVSGIQGQEVIPVAHTGELNIVLPTRVLGNLFKIAGKSNIKFQVDQEGLSAMVEGDVNGASYRLLFSVQGEA